MSVIIAASRWPIDGPTGRSGGEDAVNGGPADAGEQVYPVLGQVGRDGCPHARVPVASRGNPLAEHLLDLLWRHINYLCWGCPRRGMNAAIAAASASSSATSV